MAYTEKFKTPPLMNKCSSYEAWVKEVKIWQCFNENKTSKQGTELFLSLEGESRDAALQLDVDDINCHDGVLNIINKLDELHSKDKSERACEAYHNFEKFMRPPNMDITIYIDQFEKLLNATNHYGSKLSSDYLAYRLLKSANLTENDELIARKSLKELSYENMKSELKNIFCNSKKFSVKRTNVEKIVTQNKSNKCYKCGLSNHLLTLCPYKKDPYDVVLFQSHLTNEVSLKHFVYESFSSLVLDAMTEKTVCGKLWLDCFLDSLPSKEKLKVQTCVGKAVFKFGDGRCVKSIEKVVLPTFIGEKQIMIKSDVVDYNIPLLLSKTAMEKAGVIINYENDSVSVFNEIYKLKITNSGHYILPVGQRLKLEVATNSKTDVKLIAKTVSMSDRPKVARKLHHQFAHPPIEKLFKLVNNAGFATDDELKRNIAIVTRECEICQQVEKKIPLVELPSATRFNEIVSMDIITFENDLILHLFDHATRFSAASTLPSKEKDIVLNCIFVIWIKIFGAPTKYFSDNGCEFSKDEFNEMCKEYDITVNMKDDETLFSNNLGNRNKDIFEQTVNGASKGGADFNNSIQDIITSNNSLSNVHGFSPYQLVFGNTLPIELIQKSRENNQYNLKIMRDARKAFVATEKAERLRRALRHITNPHEDSLFLSGDTVLYKKRNSCKWKGPAHVLGQDGQIVLLKHHNSYVRCHTSRLKLENVASNSTEESEINTSEDDFNEIYDDEDEEDEILPLDDILNQALDEDEETQLEDDEVEEEEAGMEDIGEDEKEEVVVEEVEEEKEDEKEENSVTELYDESDELTSETSAPSLSEGTMLDYSQTSISYELEYDTSEATTVDINEETEKLHELLKESDKLREESVRPESNNESEPTETILEINIEDLQKENSNEGEIPEMDDGSSSGDETVIDAQEVMDSIVI